MAGERPEKPVEAVIPVQLPAEAADYLVPGGDLAEVGKGLHGPDDQARFIPQEGCIFRKGRVVPSFLVSTQRKWWTPPSPEKLALAARIVGLQILQRSQLSTVQDCPRSSFRL